MSRVQKTLRFAGRRISLKDPSTDLPKPDLDLDDRSIQHQILQWSARVTAERKRRGVVRGAPIDLAKAMSALSFIQTCINWFDEHASEEDRHRVGANCATDLLNALIDGDAHPALTIWQHSFRGNTSKYGVSERIARLHVLAIVDELAKRSKNPTGRPMGKRTAQQEVAKALHILPSYGEASARAIETWERNLTKYLIPTRLRRKDSLSTREAREKAEAAANQARDLGREVMKNFALAHDLSNFSLRELLDFAVYQIALMLPPSIIALENEE